MTDITTATGTRFYISETEVEATIYDYRLAGWVEIEQVESISEFGDECEDIAILAVGSDRIEHKKGTRRTVGFSLVVGYDPLDDGQDVISAANDSDVQFAFRVILPGEFNNILYFHALVRSDKLAIGTNSNVVRRNYVCVLTSLVLTDTSSDIPLGFLQGAGSLRVHTRMQGKATASFQGTGNLSVDIIVKVDFLLLRDGVSHLLLRDGVSRLVLEH